MNNINQRTVRLIASVVVAFALQSIAHGQSPPVAYRVTLDKNPTTHFLHISLQVNAGAASSIDVAMPAWSPGAYNIHNAWRNVQEFSATGDSGQTLNFE